MSSAALTGTSPGVDGPAGASGGRALTVARALAALAVLLLAVALGRLAAAGDAHLVLAPEPREWVLAVIGLLLGTRVVAHAPRNPVGWLFLLLGVTAGATLAASTWTGPGGPTWPRLVTWWPTYAVLPLLALLFPTGHPASRRWAVLAAATAGAVAVGAVAIGLAAERSPGGFRTVPQDGVDPPLVAFAAAVGVVALGGLGAVVSLALRWRRATGRERALIGWAAAGTALLLLAAVLEVWRAGTVWIAAALAFPAAAAVAITRYGLYDIDLIVHRALLYGATSVAIMAAYAGVVVALVGVVPQQAGLVAAVAAALVAEPARRAAQHRVDRMIYGERRNPYRLVSTLGGRLQDLLPLQEVLPTIASTVAESLKVPYVAVELPSRTGAAATHGRTRGRPQERLPLLHRGTAVGTLVVEARSPDERFTAAELEVLRGIARQAGAAVDAVGLTVDLQHARERLVLAREEERRRLRQDLHDGLGPALVGMNMQARALGRRLDPDEPLRRVLLDMAEDLSAAVVQLRALVDGLRPPTLDQGLPAAVRQEAARIGAAGELAAEVRTEGDLDALPAAVEVAAFRICCEAMTNVLKHARATACHVRLARCGQELEVTVTDDGTGPGPERDGGVGLASMRQRAEELGGRLSVAAASPGTRVHAVLPLPDGA
ncbi:hypothetical protein NUM3379_11920 [Kineococcus sp. NUM-3379]